MIRWQKNSRPDADLLAAYAAGELDGDAALAPFKEQVEKWLAEHPQDLPATENWLQDLWETSRPAEPETTHFDAILERLQSLPTDGGRRPVPAGIRWRLLAAGLAAMAAAVWLAFALVSSPQDIVKDDANATTVASTPPEAFQVASSDEIEILSVDGAATSTLVVGRVPVQGPLELLAPGDVTLTSVQPADGDNMVPRVHKGHETPLIWARVDSEP